MSWEAVPLSDLVLEKKGSLVSGPFGSNIGSRFFVEEGVPVIRGNNITKGPEKFIDNGFVYLTDEKASEFPNCIATEDDLIFTAAGSIGQVGLIPKERRFESYIISNKQIRARLDTSKADPSFVYYWLSSRRMVSYIESQNNGGAVPLLNLGIVRRLPVPLPSLKNQKRIAAILSAYDDLIENNRRRIALLEQAARLLYREWFVHFRFPGHETAKFVDGLPEGWEPAVLSDHVELRKEAVKPEQFRSDDVHIGLEHIPRRSAVLADWEAVDGLASHKFRFEAHDIIFGKIRPYFHKVGFAVRGGVASSDAFIWRVKEARLWPLIMTATSSDHFVAVASKTVRVSVVRFFGTKGGLN